jgi:hypothetical protein
VLQRNLPVTSARSNALPGGAMAEAQAVRFKDMTGKQKFVFVLKVTACVISFGMVYPNIMHD